MEDEKLPKTIEDGVSSHFERAQDIDPSIEKRQVPKINGFMQKEADMAFYYLESYAKLTRV